MSALRVINVVGCRPNFMKVAPVVTEMRRQDGFEAMVVHTGQHRGQIMSDVFFQDLDLPEPDIHLGIEPSSQTRQIAAIMGAFETVVLDWAPDLVLVVGDVSSTLACALTANKLGVPVAHVEAGLRSFDREMPEEINRVLTDQIADLLFVSEWSGVSNLGREGISSAKVFFVGNVMIDTLLQSAPKLARSKVLSRLGVEGQRYALLTLHRPSNVDDPEAFSGIVRALAEIQEQVPILFPVHPRTARKLEEFGLGRQLLKLPNIKVVAPLGYLDFIRLLQAAAFVMTDSGGIQEESTVLRIPCLTLRENTERPATLTHGTNQLVGTDTERIVAAAAAVLKGLPPVVAIPDLWDGRAARRIVEVLGLEKESIRGLHKSVRERAHQQRAVMAS
jgi:UDP-N-acetylglucosamine 2-epimerase (non-hydrolysing)